MAKNGEKEMPSGIYQHKPHTEKIRRKLSIIKKKYFQSHVHPKKVSKE